MSYVNIHGEPIDMANDAYRKRMAEARRMFPAARKPTVKNGYAADPGTGPEGETCGSCRFKHSMESNTGSKRFIKCDLESARWTHGEGTDILARSPACRAWQAPEHHPYERSDGPGSTCKTCGEPPSSRRHCMPGGGE